jgi:hypothetical protein
LNHGQRLVGPNYMRTLPAKIQDSPDFIFRPIRRV